ncbi:hypothetical protein [Candidatus Aquicultor secundus]|uniref:Uncharacterized protein n=1 Tax=Candidatus Aquicultor secundus TaxID=1973895 RepID=A0A2M7T5T2_9ACTN|nr:hypothetical protein [Candidatus Aquicultor secundus]PIZ35681.1 MAG: hypothetical protein COY37_09880 [Candidatus Aquicultor secundus]
MHSKRFYLAIAFIATFFIHGVYLTWQSMWASSKWIQTAADSSFLTNLTRYFQTQDYLLGISYGLSLAFMVYAFLRLKEGQKSGAAGLVGGATLTGLLYFGGCFLIGCCGSPMLVVYLNLFGAGFLGFAKPLVLILTMLSITIGYFWMERKAKTATCNCPGGLCGEVANDEPRVDR